jgi:hypothetical protein
MSNIKTKIAALIAKAKGTDNEHEASTFMAKAQELLEKHQLEMWELNEDDPMGHQFFGRARMQIDKSERSLLNAVARLYGANTVLARDKGKQIIDLVGRESSRITTELMWPFIMDQVRKLAKEYNVIHRVGPVRARHQIMIALGFRIKDMIKEEKRATGVASKALVTVDEVKAYVESLYPNVTWPRTKYRVGSNASEYADKVSLNRQTTGGAGVRLLA